MLIKLSPSRIDAALKCAREAVSLADLEASLMGTYESSWQMQLGSAAHSILERGGEGVVQRDGFTFTADCVQRLTAIANEYGEHTSEGDCHVDLHDEETGAEVKVYGRYDLLTATEVVDFKVGTAPMWYGHTERWAASSQWRAYALATGVERVTIHYIELSKDRRRGGAYTVKGEQKVHLFPTAYTAGELLGMAVEAHEFMTTFVPAAYEFYQKNRSPSRVR